MSDIFILTENYIPPDRRYLESHPGHAGRPGQRGGSAPSGSGKSNSDSEIVAKWMKENPIIDTPPEKAKKITKVKGSRAYSTLKRYMAKFEKEGYEQKGLSQTFSADGGYVTHNLTYTHPKTSEMVNISYTIGPTSYYNEFRMEED